VNFEQTPPLEEDEYNQVSPHKQWLEEEELPSSREESAV